MCSYLDNHFIRLVFNAKINLTLNCKYILNLLYLSIHVMLLILSEAKRISKFEAPLSMRKHEIPELSSSTI